MLKKIILFLIPCISTSKRITVDRKMLKTSPLFKEYKNRCNPGCGSNTSIIYTFNEAYQNYYRREPFKYERYLWLQVFFRSLKQAAVEVLSNEEIEPILYIILNTTGELGFIYELSPFSYYLIHHVRRLYLFCKIEEFLLKSLDVKYGTPIPFELRQNIYTQMMEILTASNGREDIYIQDFMKAKYYEFSQVESLNRSRLHEYLNNFEIQQICYEITIDLKNDSSVDGYCMFVDKLRFLPFWSSKRKNKDCYLLVQKGIVEQTKIATNITSFQKARVDQFFINFYKICNTKSKKSVTNLREAELDEFYMKEMILEKSTFEVFMSLILYYTNVLECCIIIKNVLTSDATIIVSLMPFTNDVSRCLNYYKKSLNHTEEMKNDIAKRIKEKKNHKFMTMNELLVYSFKKPNLKAVPHGNQCLQIECGHFLGDILINEYIETGKNWCYICNKRSMVIKYFEAPFYLIKD